MVPQTEGYGDLVLKLGYKILWDLFKAIGNISCDMEVLNLFLFEKGDEGLYFFLAKEVWINM